MKGLKIITLFFVALLAGNISCNQQTDIDIIPFAYVNTDLYLKNIQYQDLRRQGGFIYLEEVGFRGIIVYNDGTRFRAFERACTYDPRSKCEPVKVDDSTLFMVHECCASVYNFDGYPTAGPAPLPLREYVTFVEGDYLLIRNE
jgi:hypothetical protein